MRDTGNQSFKPIKPSPNPDTLPAELDHSSADAQHGEGSYRGTRDYQKGIKTYLENADVEQDARDAAPDTPEEARALEEAEAVGRKPAVKTQRPSKRK